MTMTAKIYPSDHKFTSINIPVQQQHTLYNCEFTIVPIPNVYWNMIGPFSRNCSWWIHDWMMKLKIYKWLCQPDLILVFYKIRPVNIPEKFTCQKCSLIKNVTKNPYWRWPRNSQYWGIYFIWSSMRKSFQKGNPIRRDNQIGDNTLTYTRLSPINFWKDHPDWIWHIDSR